MRRALLITTMMTLLLCAAFPAAAQPGTVYCNIIEIKAEQLSNAVKITIQADGELQGGLDWWRVIESGEWELVEREWGTDLLPTEKATRLPLEFRNARSQLGAGFIPIDMYPVSHVEVSIPDWAAENDGVGVYVDIVTCQSFLGEEEGWWRYDFYAPRTEDGQGRVVALFSDRFPAPPPPKTPEDLPSELAVLAGDAGLSVHAVNAKLQDVANRIAAATGLCVDCPTDPDLRVSCHLDRLPIATALQAIALGCGLCDWRQPDGDFLLAPEPTSGASYGNPAGFSIALRYLRAREAIDLLPNFLLSYLHADDESNAVVVTGPAWMAERVAADLAKLDLPPPELVAEIEVVEYTSLGSLSRSLDLARFANQAGFHLDPAGGEVDFLRLEGLPDGWSAALTFLEASSTGRLRSRSTLRVLNGKSGRIFAGQQRTIVVEQMDYLYGGPTSAALEQVDIGATLEVRPRLGEGEEMVLSFYAEVDNLSATDPISGLPIISRRSVYSTLQAKAGDTVLVSGLRLSDQTRQDRALPLLARLPVLGGLFRAPDRSRSDLRVAVFLTPHIVRSQAQAKGATDNG